MPGGILRHWHWLDDGLLPLAAAAAYAAWAYPVFAVYVHDPLTGAANEGFSYSLCLGTLLGGTIAGRLAARSRKGGLIVVAGGFAAILASVLLAIHGGASAREDPWFRDTLLLRTVIATFACAALLWWRGVRMARADHHEETSRTFVVGALALASLALVGHLYSPAGALRRTGYVVWALLALGLLSGAMTLVLLATLSRADERVLVSAGETLFACTAVLLSAVLPSLPSPHSLGGPVLLFVFAGLATRALLGLSWALNTQRGQGGVRLHVDKSWLGTVGGAVLAVIALGLLIGQVLTPQAARSALRGLWRVFAPLIRIVAYVAFALVSMALDLLMYLLSGLSFRFPELATPTPEAMEGAREGIIQLSPAARQGLGVLLALVVLAGVGWILYRTARRLSLFAGPVADAGEQRSTALSLRLLQRQVRDAFRRLRRSRSAPLPLVMLGAGGARRAIRRAYRTVLRRAIVLDTPREKGQTPDAYADALADLCRGETSSIETLTAAYDAARYGASPPTQQEVQAARQAAARVDAALRQRRREGT